MISERETELRIEAWLHDEARPMPQDVLEASIDGVVRTRQTSAHRPAALRSLTDRRLVALAAMAAVLAVVVGSRIIDRPASFEGAGSGSGSFAALQWDASADFLRFTEHANPSPDRYGNPGVWSYMRSASDSHDPATYMLLPDFVVEGDIDTWYDDELQTVVVGASRSIPTISMHPWSSGDRAESHHAILAWRSPVTGTVELTGGVHHVERFCPEGRTDGTTLFIDLDGESLLSVALAPGESELIASRVEVVAGQSIYFVVDPGQASICDATNVTLSISQVAP